MSAASDLLQELTALGATLWQDAGRLHYKAPAHTLTPEHLAALKAHKVELLALVPLMPDTAPTLGPAEHAELYQLVTLAVLPHEVEEMFGAALRFGRQALEVYRTIAAELDEEKAPRSSF